MNTEALIKAARTVALQKGQPMPNKLAHAPDIPPAGTAGPPFAAFLTFAQTFYEAGRADMRAELAVAGT